MSITEEFLAALPTLSNEERTQVVQALQDLTVGEDTQTASAMPLPIYGLHEGTWWIAEDAFDPLPDDFWFSK